MTRIDPSATGATAAITAFVLAAANRFVRIQKLTLRLTDPTTEKELHQLRADLAAATARILELEIMVATLRFNVPKGDH